jgi:hypothetical protein
MTPLRVVKIVCREAGKTPIVILSNGVELEDVEEVKLDLDYEHGKGTLTLTLNAPLPIDLVPPSCDHKWVRCGASLMQEGMDSYICRKCDETKLEPSERRECKHVWRWGSILIKKETPPCGSYCIHCGLHNQYEHSWMKTDLPKIDGTKVEHCVSCRRYK